MLTKGAIGNLINRYRAVLKKCHLLNAFGSLAVASMLVLGGAGGAEAVGATYTNRADIPPSASYTNDTFSSINHSGNGGAILTDSNLTLIGCTFTDNSANKRGGAIRSETSLTIDDTQYIDASNPNTKNTTFINNKALTVKTSGKLNIKSFDGMGGALDISGTTTITGTAIDKENNSGGVLFEGNKSNSAGAVYIFGGTSTFTNVRFINNEAAVDGGGAVKISKSSPIQSITFSNVLFEGNKTSNNGGAVYVVGTDGPVTFKNVDFRDNISGNSGGGAIYNKSGMTINFEGINNFSGNKEGYGYTPDYTNVTYTFTDPRNGFTPKDIYNAGTINVNGGTTSIGGGITGTGTLNIAETATLKLDADVNREAHASPAVPVENVVTNAGTIHVVDAASFNKSIQSKGGTIKVDKDAKLTITANKANSAIFGDFDITGDGSGFGDVTLKSYSAKNSNALASATDYNNANAWGTVTANIEAKSLTLDATGSGIKNLAGTHTITADGVTITAANGGHGIQAQGDGGNALVTINFGDDGLSVTKKEAQDSGHALYAVDGGSSSKIEIFSKDGTAGKVTLAGDHRAAFAVVGKYAEGIIDAAGDVEVGSSILAGADDNRKGHVLYASAGKMNIETDGKLTVVDNGAAKKAIGVAKGGEIKLTAKQVDITGNISTSAAAGESAYGTQADADAHGGKLFITATGAGSAINGRVNIGAKATVSLSGDITFEGQRNTDQNAVIYNSGTLIVEGATFSDNEVRVQKDAYGGVIRNASGGTVSLTDTDFIGNKAIATENGNGSGGAIRSHGGSVTVTGGEFKNNFANKMGGAVYLADGTSGSFKDVSFTENITGALGAGGALALNAGSAGTVEYRIDNCDFTNNTTAYKDAGALQIQGAAAQVAIIDTDFTGNSAKGAGGAISNSSVINFSGINTFSGNVEKADITYSEDANGKVSCTVSGGTANDIYNTGTINVLSGSTTLGGGISGTGAFNNAGTLEVKGGTVSGYTGDFTQTKGVTDIFAIDNYFGGKVDIQGGDFVADYDVMMDEATDKAKISADQIGKLSVADGASLTLNLGLDDGNGGLTDRIYTLSDYFSAKDALMRDDAGKLVFTYAKLQQAAGDSILLGQTGGSASVEGLVFASKGYQSYEDALAAVPSQKYLDVAAGNMVILADADSKAHTNSATSVSFGSDLIAKGMHIGTMKDLTVKSGADLAFAATNADGLFLGADGKSVAVNVNVEEGASFKLGLASDETAQKATLGDVTVGGTFNVGNGVAEASYTFGDVTVTEKGSATFRKATVSANGLTASGALSVEGCSVAAESFTVSGGTTSLVNSALAVPALAISGGEAKLESVSASSLKEVTASGGKLELSETDLALDKLSISAGSLNIVESDVTIDTLTASGGTIDVDPSTVIIKELAGGELGSALRVRDSSAVVIGGDSIDGAVPGTSEHTAGKATLVLGKPITLSGTGGILVDPLAAADAPVDAGSAIFADGSLLAVKASDAAKGAVITGTGTGKIERKGMATLYIADAGTNQTYRIAEKFTEADCDDTAWSLEHGTLIINSLLDVELNQNKLEDGSVEFVTRTKLNEDSAFFDAIPSNALHELADAGLEVDIDNAGNVSAGKKFLSRAAESTAIGYTSSVNEGVAMVNEVSRAAVTAGVQNTSLRIADAASNTVVDHMSLSQHSASSSIHADGVDFWAAPMYGNLYTSGMVTSGSSVRGQFGGLALGADLEAGQFLGGKFRLGAAINGGGGQSETKGNVTSTQNDYDFGGINFYAGWNSGALNIIGSVGYGFGNHEVEMGLPSSMGMGSAKADIDTTVFTADLRAEYQIKTDWVDFLPHAGVRYTALRTSAHDLTVGGDVLNSVESDTQNIVQFPIGVTLSKDFALSGWSVKPMVDVSVIPAAGEKKATTKVNFSGMDAWDSVNTRIMDSTSWAGTVGVQAEKGNMTFGLNYGVQASSNETDQNIQVKFGWKF